MSLWENTSGEPIESGGVPVECGECPCDACVCDIEWEFTDRGFIDGGQDGALRTYSDPGDVTASPWTLAGSCGLRLDFEDSDDVPVAYDGLKPPTTGAGCANHNAYIQRATATGEFTLASPGNITVTWTGQGERQDPIYEVMALYIDGDLLSRAHAPGGNLGCTAPGPIVSEPVEGLLCYPVSAGAHTIEVRASTNDHFYHVGAYYKFILHCGSECVVQSCCIDPFETGPTAAISAVEDVDCEWTITSSSTAGSCGEIVSCRWTWSITRVDSDVSMWGETIVDEACAGFSIDVLEMLCEARASGFEDLCPGVDPQVISNNICTCGIHTLTVTLTVTDEAGCTDTVTEEYQCGCEITEIPGYSLSEADGCGEECPPGCCYDVTVSWPTEDSCGNELVLIGFPGSPSDCPCAQPGPSGTGGSHVFEDVCAEGGMISGNLQLARANSTCCTGPAVNVEEDVSPCGCCSGCIGGALVTVSGVGGGAECDCSAFNDEWDVPAIPAAYGYCATNGETTIITCVGDAQYGLTLSWSLSCGETVCSEEGCESYWLSLSFGFHNTISGTVISFNESFNLGTDKPLCSAISGTMILDSRPEWNVACDFRGVSFSFDFY